MARPKMPPTPASSTEIKGQDHSNKLSSLQLTFELPPSAITPGSEASKSSTSGPKMSPVSPTSTLPYLQPSETVKARRRSTATQQKETFALPPPPTRSRKIIQMKPCPQDEGATTPAPTKGGSSTASTSQTRHAAGSGVASASGSKTTTTSTKKQPSATSAAGRKIARKTAHSLIERRRRSKMNEEFAVLKGLIPACTGEMHKLAILQASIEYVRYLEDCITKLKAQHAPDSTNTPPAFQAAQRAHQDSYAEEEGSTEWHGTTTGPDGDEEATEDVEMTDSSSPSPTLTAARSVQSSISPALAAQDGHYSHHSHTHPHSHRSSISASSEYHAYNGAASPLRGLSYPPLASPALRPQLEIDHEVSAALLMLGSGRTSVSGPGSGSGSGSGRGMSVRDLLSS
ncbi:hypothetical protein F5B17DRAFT_99259 [Nemania serpens]|nr:hypothetical protein F5B17DRAFT_99259 [Nemania serpens]